MSPLKPYYWSFFVLAFCALHCKKPSEPVPVVPEVKDTISPELQAAIDQLPAATDTGANILGFITKDNTPFAFFPSGEHESTFLKSFFDGYFLNIGARKHDDDGVVFYVGFNILLIDGPPDTTQTYPLIELGAYPIQQILYTYRIDYRREGPNICSYLNGAPFQSSKVEQATGAVEFTRIDTTNGIYSGTFNFFIDVDSTYYEDRYDDYCPNPLNAFYGRFDVKAPTVEPGTQ